MARNYEEILDIYMNHFPETSFEELRKTANLGFANFRMSDSIDKGLQMLAKVAKYSRGDPGRWLRRDKPRRELRFCRRPTPQLWKTRRVSRGRTYFTKSWEWCWITTCLREWRRCTWTRSSTSTASTATRYLLEEAERAHQSAPHHYATRSRQSWEGNVRTFQLVNSETHRIPAFLESHECEVADELIKAYKKGDGDKFLKWTTKPEVTCIFPVTVSFHLFRS